MKPIVCHVIQISHKFILKGPINNSSAFVGLMGISISGISNYMPEILCAVITYICRRHLRTWLLINFQLPVASFTKEVNSRLAKCPLVFNGHLANHRLTSSVKETTVWASERFPIRCFVQHSPGSRATAATHNKTSTTSLQTGLGAFY